LICGDALDIRCPGAHRGRDFLWRQAKSYWRAASEARIFYGAAGYLVAFVTLLVIVAAILIIGGAAINHRSSCSGESGHPEAARRRTEFASWGETFHSVRYMVH
jgi:hypothetical protein